MTTPAIIPQMVESLAQASSLQLYQLRSLVEGLLADPRRAITGVVVRINPQTATVDLPSGETWRVPFKLLRQVVDI